LDAGLEGKRRSKKWVVVDSFPEMSADFFRSYNQTKFFESYVIGE
jgi:hypothetical protein